MSGLVPDPLAGSVVITDQDGNSINPVPQAGLFNNYGTAFTVSGGLSYLQLPVVGGSCGGRITQMQMNYVESELLALAQAFDASFTWIPGRGNNIAVAFSSQGGGEVQATDLFGSFIGYISTEE